MKRISPGKDGVGSDPGSGNRMYKVLEGKDHGVYLGIAGPSN